MQSSITTLSPLPVNFTSQRQSRVFCWVGTNPGRISARLYKPVGDSRLRATHWGPWQEVLLSSNLHFTVTPPPYPHCSGTRPDSGRGKKVQLKTPFSHLERPVERGPGRRMQVEAKQIISQSNPRRPARRQVLELEINPRENARRKLRHGGSGPRNPS